MTEQPAAPPPEPPGSVAVPAPVVAPPAVVGARPAAAAPPRGFGALSHPNFRLFLGGQFISLAGTWMHQVGQGWLVLELTDSAFQVGLVTTLGALPLLLFTLLGGVVADRVNRRRLIFTLQFLMLLDALAMAVLTDTGRISVGWVMLLAVAFGTFTAFEVPARQAFIVELVGKRDLMNAIALNASAFNLTRVIGPAIGGVILTAAGVAACFYVNAGSFVAVLIGLALLRLPPPTQPAGATRGWQALVEGTRYVRHTPWPRALMTIAATFSIFGFAVTPMLPVFARDALGAGAGGYGTLVASIGAGAAAGSIFLAAFRGRLRRRRLVFMAGMSFGVLLMAAAMARPFWLATLLLALNGLAMILATVTINTLLQTEAPDGLRGRVMGFYSFVVLGMAPFGAFQMGWLADRFGIRTAIGVGGLVCLLVSAHVAWRMRGVPAPVPGREAA